MEECCYHYIVGYSFNVGDEPWSSFKLNTLNECLREYEKTPYVEKAYACVVGVDCIKNVITKVFYNQELSRILKLSCL